MTTEIGIEEKTINTCGFFMYMTQKQPFNTHPHNFNS